MYMDSDVIINHYFKINNAFEVGLSPAFIDPQLASDTGKYNAGYIWTRSKTFLENWAASLPLSKYFDQDPLSYLKMILRYLNLIQVITLCPEASNPEQTAQDFLRTVSSSPGGVYINDDRLKSIHTHVLRQDFKMFNKFLVKHLDSGGEMHALLAIDLIKMSFLLRNRN